MANFFVSDIHFGHARVLEFDNRPWSNVEEMDKAIIKNWNERVDIFDDVYILGDISWYNVSKTIDILQRLNGYKHLIIGNHDNAFLKTKDFRDCFIEIANYKELDNGTNNKIVLSHYPLVTFNKCYYGWYHLYGHVHNSFEWNMIEHFKDSAEELYPDKPRRMYNVGIMMPYMHYAPQKIEDIVSGYDLWKSENF